MSAGVAGNRFVSVGYSLLFFGFLFAPLVIMTVTAFNSSSFPRILPWECFTTDWFGVLVRDRRLMEGLMTSAIIGVCVVAISVPVGLAGAIALSEVGPRVRAVLYTVLLVPILIPGVVLGISTIVFWGNLGRSAGAGYDTFFFNGKFLTIAGHVTFIAAYAMLIFSARLQRFDPTLTEAALDLGATPGQAFRKVMLPFLRPAIASAGFLTLLASFENYNTTVFTILAGSTFTTALASKVRYGIDPSLSALAVIIIALTLIGAITSEAFTRRREAVLNGRARSGLYANPLVRSAVHPATVGVLLIAVASSAVWQGSQHDSGTCRETMLQEKRANQERFLQEQQRRLREAAPSRAPTPSTAPPAVGTNPSPFGGAFSSGSLAPSPAAPPRPGNPSP
ncbi:ABC transporter permease [Terrihabitans rhizophilus]|uniref:ABC transporter permease n=1 Tax=Terrihabitans rhizophilus TaxID=3092662 RepID=A0ABU4RM55_9HYPH|nr:ABC transporter permease [Terrihabitans sp. PJ23]MDX6804750.1 ABC transporter permease [Terrihabitans sp. PJ23]